MIQMYTVGRLLRKSREASRLTIEDAAKQLHIRVDYLKALESDNLEVFKSPTHVKGLVKNYCRLLDIDYEKILPFLRRQLGEEEIQITQKLAPVQVNSIQISYVHLFIGALVVLAGILVFMVVRAYLKTVSPPLLEIIEPKQRAIEVHKAKLNIQGFTEDKVTVLINGEQVPLEEDNSFSATVQLTEGENRIIVEAYKNYAQDKRTQKELIVTYTPQVQEQNSLDASKTLDQVKVRLEIVDQEAWILIKADDKQLAVGIKPKGYKYEFEPKKYFEIITGRPSVTRVYMNNKELKFKAEEGKIYIYCALEVSQWQCK